MQQTREREKRLKNNQISLLCKYGLTEKDAQELAAEYGLLSPIYNYAKRGGCFFCPNATIKELKYLYKNNFELFQKLKELENKPDVIGAVFDTRKKRSLTELEKRLNENNERERNETKITWTQEAARLNKRIKRKAVTGA